MTQCPEVMLGWENSSQVMSYVNPKCKPSRIEARHPADRLTWPGLGWPRAPGICLNPEEDLYLHWDL